MNRNQHIEGFEILRTICSAAVVGIHTFHTNHGLAWLSRIFLFAVPCFVMISTYLSARYISRSKLRWNFIRQRAVRLIPAFLAWTLIYAAARWVSGGINFPSLNNYIQYLFLGSVALHLYYIPMIFYYSIFLTVLPESDTFRIWVCLIGLFVSAWLRYADISSGSHKAATFLFYFIYNMPFFFLGVLLFDLIEKNSNFKLLHKHIRVSTVLCGIGTVVFLIGPFFINRYMLVQHIAQHTFLFLTFLLWPFRVPRFVITVAAVSFGIYLSHHLIAEGLFRLEEYVGLTSNTFTVTLMRFFFCTVMAMGFSILLMRNRKTRWLVA